MKVVIQILLMLPAVIKAVQEVEAAFPPGSGKEKLGVVLKAIEAGLGAEGADVASKVIPAVEAVVNRIVEAFNVLGVFKK